MRMQIYAYTNMCIKLYLNEDQNSVHNICIYIKTLIYTISTMYNLIWKDHTYFLLAKDKFFIIQT